MVGVMENNLTTEEIVQLLTKILIKAHEVSALLKDGKTIIAYEKLGGVIKNLSALGSKIQSCSTQSMGPSVDTE